LIVALVCELNIFKKLSEYFPRTIRPSILVISVNLALGMLEVKTNGMVEVRVAKSVLIPCNSERKSSDRSSRIGNRGSDGLRYLMIFIAIIRFVLML